MTQEERTIQRDRMRFTKDKRSANLVLLAIVFDALYFVSIYQSDPSTYYYNWTIGASIIYNLLFLLTAFLASEAVKSRKGGFAPVLIVLGVLQIVRIFYIPAKAHASVVTVGDVETAVMTDGQYIYVVVCLAVSAACCILAAVNSTINNRALAEHMKSIEKQSV